MVFPLVAFKNNIVFNQQGEPFALYPLKSFPYNNLPKYIREHVIKQMEQLLWGLEGRKGMLLFLCEELYVSEREYLEAAAMEPSEEAFRHAAEVRRTLLAGARKRRKYLAVQLSATALEDDWRAFLMECRDTVMGAFCGTERWLLNSQRLQKALESEEELFKKIRHATHGRAVFADLDFILRRNTKRVGVLPPPLASRDGGHFTPAILSAFSDGCKIDGRPPTYITIRNGSDEVQYQTFITFPDVPRELPLTGAEWLASLDVIGMAVDAAVHFEITKSHKAKKQVLTRRKFLKGQIKEAESGNDEASEEENDALHRAKNLISRLGSGEPLSKFSTVIGLADRDLKTLRANANTLKETYSTRGFYAVRPIGDQLKCFYSFIPGSKPAAPMIQANPGFLAAGGPSVSLDLGDETGPLLGWTGSFPVHWKAGYAARILKRSNASFIAGALGGGKSLLIKYLIYLAYLAGAYVFVIDPKMNEYAVLEKLFPITKIDLCPGGKDQLNPFMISCDPLTAKGIVTDYLFIALNIREDNDSRRIVVGKAVEMTAALPPEKRNMHSCLEAFREIQEILPDQNLREEAYKCALLLEDIRNSDLGRLVFGTGHTQNIARATVVNMQGLPLPESAERLKLGISPNERQGLGLLYLASTMAKEVAFTLPPEILKIIPIDESWMMLNISEGKRVIDSLIRKGARSHGAIPILGTQNTTDVEDFQGLRNNISYIFTFRTAEKNEIKANLDLLGADMDEEALKTGLAAQYPNLSSGWCIMRDALGRIGRVYIHPHPEDLIDLFDTSPKEAKKNAV